MGKPRRLMSYPEQEYPTLHEYDCERRAFLRKLALGAIGIGMGGRLLGCTSTLDISGRPADLELEEVRLPGSGLASAYMRYDEYMRYSVTFATHDAALASYFRENETVGIEILSAALFEHECAAFTDGRLPAVHEALRLALEEGYEARGGAPGPGIRTLALEVGSCEYVGAPDGGMDMPDYP